MQTIEEVQKLQKINVRMRAFERRYSEGVVREFCRYIKLGMKQGEIVFMFKNRMTRKAVQYWFYKLGGKIKI